MYVFVHSPLAKTAHLPHINLFCSKFRGWDGCVYYAIVPTTICIILFNFWCQVFEKVNLTRLRGGIEILVNDSELEFLGWG
jgi:hypothetical protein